MTVIGKVAFLSRASLLSLIGSLVFFGVVVADSAFLAVCFVALIGVAVSLASALVFWCVELVRAQCAMTGRNAQLRIELT